MFNFIKVLYSNNKYFIIYFKLNIENLLKTFYIIFLLLKIFFIYLYFNKNKPFIYFSYFYNKIKLLYIV